MLSRKHIKVPKTFDPGPKHPVERLAYLNDAEMEMLRVLTDGTVSRGPNGVPSFAIGNATASISKTSSNMAKSSPTASTGKMGSGTGGSTASRSGASGMSAGSSSKASSPKASAPASSPNTARSGASGMSTAKTSPTVSRAPSAPMGGGGSISRGPAASMAASAAPAKPMAAPAAAPSFGPPRSLAGIGSPSSKAGSSKQPVAAAAMSAPQKNAYLQAGRLIGQPVGNTAKFPGQGQGLQVNGRPVVDRANRPIGPNDATDFNAAARSLYGDSITTPDRFSSWANEGLSRINNRSRFQTDTETRTMAGEVGSYSTEDIAAAVNTLNNRLALGANWSGPMGLAAYDANGIRTGISNRAYRNANPGTSAYNQAVLGQAAAVDPASNFNQTAPRNVLNATHYLTPSAENAQAVRAARIGVGPSTWSQSANFVASRTPYGPHVFGNPENTADRVAELRGGTSEAVQTAAAAQGTGGFQTASATAPQKAATSAPIPQARPWGPPPIPQARPWGAPPIPTARPERSAEGMSFTPALPAAMPPKPTARSERSVEGMAFTPALPAAMPVRTVPVPTARPPVQGPPRPLAGDPRVSLPQGAFPAARTVPVPTARPPVQGPPRPVGGMSFNPALPAQQLPGIQRNPFDGAAPAQYAGYGASAPAGKQIYGRVAQEQGPVQQVDVRSPRVAAATYTTPYDVKAPAVRPFNGVGSPGLPPGYAERYGLGPKPAAPESPAPAEGGWVSAAWKAGTDAVNTVKETKKQVDQAVKDVKQKYGRITETKVKLAKMFLGIGGGTSKVTAGTGNQRAAILEDPQVRAIVAQVLATQDPAAPIAPAPVDWSYFTNVKTREQALADLLGKEWQA